MYRHLASIGLICIAVTVIYWRVSGTYFCGFDDFTEAHRAAFEDAKAPSRIFTTTHFDTPKYRPLSRSLSFASYWAGRGDPIFFRARNLAFHLLTIAVLYGIGWLLFHSWPIATAAALLFGLHPLANQVVVAASFNNTAANCLLLASLFWFILSLQAKRRTYAYLTLSLACACITVFIYESGIVIFVLLYGYLFLVWRPRRVPRRFIGAMTAGSGIILSIFTVARFMAVPNAATRTPLALLLKNSAMYVGALLMPVDSVFAHEAFGTPLPSEIHLDVSRRWVFLCAAVLPVLLLALFWIWRKRIQLYVRQLVEWPVIFFFIGAAAVTLGPFLLFNAHPSETYLPLPVAFYSLLLSLVIARLIVSRWKYAAVIGSLAVLFGAATWVRNGRVVRCGDIAQQIISGLPTRSWRAGNWLIYLSGHPSDIPLTRYGMYAYQGLATIDGGDLSLSPTAPECALQLAALNENVKVMDVPAAKMPMPCPRVGTCFWIHADGHVEEAGAGVSEK